MKKIILASSLITFLAILVLPILVLAQPASPPECCTLSRSITLGTQTCNSGARVGPLATAPCDAGSINCVRNNWGMYCLVNGIYTVTDWVFFILIAVVAIMVIWGAFNIVTAGGDPGKVSTGRNFIVYAMVGFALALLAKAIPSIAQAILGM